VNITVYCGWIRRRVEQRWTENRRRPPSTTQWAPRRPPSTTTFSTLRDNSDKTGTVMTDALAEKTKWKIVLHWAGYPLVPESPWIEVLQNLGLESTWKWRWSLNVLEKFGLKFFLCIIGLLRSDTVNFCKIVIQLITYLRLDGRIAMLPCGSYLRKGRWKSLNSKAWEDGVPWLRRGIINCGDGWMKVILYYVQCYKYFGAFISLVWSDLITKPPAMQSSMLGACPKPG